MSLKWQLLFPVCCSGAIEFENEARTLLPTGISNRAESINEVTKGEIDFRIASRFSK